MNVDYTLYLCTNTDMIHDKAIEQCVEEAILGGVTVVQVREKNKSTDDFINIARKVKAVTEKYKIPLIINDRVDIAVAVDADGVHLGKNDMDCYTARKILGDSKIIGVTVSNSEEALQAQNDSADYVGVGAMFQSTTKPDAKIVGFDDLIKIQSSVDIPVVIIGGINQNTIPFFEGLDINGYAMIRPIICSDNIIDTTAEIKRLIRANHISKS